MFFCGCACGSDLVDQLEDVIEGLLGLGLVHESIEQESVVAVEGVFEDLVEDGEEAVSVLGGDLGAGVKDEFE